MGRGLSELQKFILIRARLGYYFRIKNPHLNIPCDLLKAEVFELYYHWQLKFYDSDYDNIDWEKSLIDGLQHRFIVDKIGKKKYNSAHAAVSKSFKRLEKRGLVIRRSGRLEGRKNEKWSGVDITEKGIKLAKTF